MEAWHGYAGPTPKGGASLVEPDDRDSDNRLNRSITTRAGQRYTLKFWMSPRPGMAQELNRLEVNWSGTKLASLAPNGEGLTRTRAGSRSYTVVGSGQHVQSVCAKRSDSGKAGSA